MNLKKVTPRFFVSEQVNPHDIGLAAAQGIKTIICMTEKFVSQEEKKSSVEKSLFLWPMAEKNSLVPAVGGGGGEVSDRAVGEGESDPAVILQLRAFEFK